MIGLQYCVRLMPCFIHNGSKFGWISFRCCWCSITLCNLQMFTDHLLNYGKGKYNISMYRVPLMSGVLLVISSKFGWIYVCMHSLSIIYRVFSFHV